MNGLTAADFADTGQWRLIVKIYPTGISAHLENTLHPDLEPQLLFETEWEQEPDGLLRKIENAVYDHPRVLDDFSARIIVFDSKTVFMPTELVEDTEGAEETYYTAVYDADPADVMTDTDRDLTAAYAPAPGLRGFLSRTFPGAKVECNLMEQVRTLRGEGEGKRMYVTVRDGEADFILLDGSMLLSASTHPWGEGADIVYHAVNILDVYDVALPEATVILSGRHLPEDTKVALERFTGQCIVRQT